jgi:thiol-disulfide isomerase/thioredoxin
MRKILTTLLLMLTTIAFADVQVLDDTNFYEETKGKIYIIDFYADWCGPCVNFAPTFKKVAAKVKNANFAKVDVDVSSKVSNDFSIQYIPFIAAVKDGSFLEEYTGNRSESDFEKWCSSFTDDSKTEAENNSENSVTTKYKGVKIEPVNSHFTEEYGGGEGFRYKIRNVQINDRGNIFKGKKGGTFQVTMEILHDCGECGNAVNQVIVGLSSDKKAQASVWNGKKRSGGPLMVVNVSTSVEAYAEDNSGQAEWVTVYYTITVPNRKGIYYLRTRYAQAYTGNLRTKAGLQREQREFLEPLQWWKVDRPKGPGPQANIGAFIID